LRAVLFLSSTAITLPSRPSQDARRFARNPELARRSASGERINWSSGIGLAKK
jgi:hypothetical protein